MEHVKTKQCRTSEDQVLNFYHHAKFKYSISIKVSSDFQYGFLTFDSNNKGNINPKSSSALKFMIARSKSVFH
jgi:hypothetical protein